MWDVLTEEEKQDARRGVDLADTHVQTPSWKKRIRQTLEDIDAGMPGSKDWEGVEFALTVLYEGRINYLRSNRQKDAQGNLYEANPDYACMERCALIRDKLRGSKNQGGK